jgi:hypothetical protein
MTLALILSVLCLVLEVLLTWGFDYIMLNHEWPFLFEGFPFILTVIYASICGFLPRLLTVAGSPMRGLMTLISVVNAAVESLVLTLTLAITVGGFGLWLAVFYYLVGAVFFAMSSASNK